MPCRRRITFLRRSLHSATLDHNSDCNNLTLAPYPNPSTGNEADIVSAADAWWQTYKAHDVDADGGEGALGVLTR